MMGRMGKMGRIVRIRNEVWMDGKNGKGLVLSM